MEPGALHKIIQKYLYACNENIWWYTQISILSYRYLVNCEGPSARNWENDLPPPPPRDQKKSLQRGSLAPSTPYNSYENAGEASIARFTTTILWPVKVIFKKKAAMVEVDTCTSPILSPCAPAEARRLFFVDSSQGTLAGALRDFFGPTICQKKRSKIWGKLRSIVCKKIHSSNKNILRKIRSADVPP